METDDKTAKTPSLRDRLISAASGVGSLLPLGIGTSLLGGALGRGLLTSGPTISSDEAAAYPARAFGRDQPVMIDPGRPPHSGRYISLPEEEGGRVRLPIAAHEAGHMHGGLLQGAGSAVNNALFVRPEIGGVHLPMVSPLHLPLLYAAASPVEKEDKGLWAWIKRNPAALAAGLAAIPLAAEAHASLRGLNAIRKTHGTSAMLKSAPLMARAFGTHALEHAVPVAGLWTAGKVRDLLARWRAKKETPVEKRAGTIERLNDRPSVGSFVLPSEWSDYPHINTPRILIRPRGQASRSAEPDRTEILHSNTSTVPGVQA
jgi:hypothetical protein